jgi:hypothetical protein
VTQQIQDAPPPVERDRYGRPYVIPPGGGKPVPYTRATTLAETLDDRFNLEQWKLRQVAIGLAARPDLIALVGAQRDDKAALNRVTADALDASESGAKANKGTALHAFTEQIDRGQEPFGVPANMIADLATYTEITARYTIEGIEEFVVCDELKVAGTFDRIFRRDNTAYVGDLKTGAGAITYGQPSIAVQLAVYAHGQRYNTATGERTPLDVDQRTAIVVHLPAETGTAQLYEVDIEAGWEAAKQAVWVRNWRKQRGLFAPLRATETVSPLLLVRSLLDRATTVAELYELYARLVADGHDADPMVALFAARKVELTGA